MRALAVTVGSALAALAVPPAPATFVTDPGGFLTEPGRQAVEARLAAHERATGQQLLVWIGTRGPEAGEASIEEWAARSFQAWAVGRKGKDDGVVLFVLPAERKARIEVGYGLEPWLTDARAARVIREQLAPRLQQDDRDGAVRAAVDGILAAVAPAAEGQPPPAAQPGERRGRGDWAGLVLLAIFLVIALGGASTHPAAAAGMLYTLGSRRSRGGFGGGGGGLGGGFGGGGFGGGGFGGGSGGFSGGGGRSGGGGASGSW